MFSWCLCGIPLSAPVSPTIKDMQQRGHYILTEGVNVCEPCDGLAVRSGIPSPVTLG